MLVQSCVKRGHKSHALNERCAILQRACLQAIESFAGSPNDAFKVVQELSCLLDSPADAVFFDEDCLHRAFKLFFELWIGIERHVPEFRVPNYVSFHRVSSRRRRVQAMILYVILLSKCFICDHHSCNIRNKKVTI